MYDWLMWEERNKWDNKKKDVRNTTIKINISKKASWKFDIFS